MSSQHDELLEVVDEHGRSLRPATRAECHSDPTLIHRSVCVLVYDPTGSLFLQERSRKKDQYPGMRDLSATGHARYGESDIEAARRELLEELGIRARLQRVDTLLVRAPTESEFTAIFQCSYDGALVPNPEEIAGGDFLPLTEARALSGLTPFAEAILHHISA